MEKHRPYFSPNWESGTGGLVVCDQCPDLIGYCVPPWLVEEAKKEHLKEVDSNL